MDVKVLGAGCLKLDRVVIETLGVREAHVELVSARRMMDDGLLGDRAPGLLVNGKPAWAGSVPTKEQVTEWLQRALNPTPA